MKTCLSCLFRKQKANCPLAIMGWGGSVLIHGIVVGIFIWVSGWRSAVPYNDSDLPKTTIEMVDDSLPVEAVVSDLYVMAPGIDYFLDEEVSLPPPPEKFIDDDKWTADTTNPPILTDTPDSPSGFDAETALKPLQFCGISGTGKRSCYVVDCSGSMVMARNFLRHELQQTVASLEKDQYFQIILYGTGRPTELTFGRLIPANAKNRDRAFAFIDQIRVVQVPSPRAASAAVLEAIKHALFARTEDGKLTEEVFFLTDGDYDQQMVERQVGRLQSRRKKPAVIHVIGCGNPGNEKFLQKLATENQGRYRFLSDEVMARFPNQNR